MIPLRANALLLAAALSLAAPALPQGAKTSSPIDMDVSELKPGQFIWNGDLAPEGPMTVIVHLPTQRAYVYRNGIRIGVTTVSTGKKGHKTPTGIFTILQKNKDHKSNLYNNAPMPYMQRLTWDGIALHAGNLPGYPASHGCIRMPMEFSKKLFEASSMGMTVVVTNDRVTPEIADTNAFLAPVTAKGVPDDPTQRRLGKGEDWRWTPEKSPAGPVTIVLSTDNGRVLVFRNGVEIGRSKVKVEPGFEIGTRALQYAGTGEDGQTRWIYLPLPGYETEKRQVDERTAVQAISIPEDFNRLVRSVIGPGTTVLATHGGMKSGSSGRQTTVIATDG
ncbi:L,D-transpeptidase [Sandaracinobacter sp. RS1-74]|uniref:L,D-transpeptidase n=1 Tax=Sandaracinobacteroides sayramensis TaxID=2913411 RepID=UPI001EDC4C2A|nr:L,D-transpeptidase [Sandaracinobacteroides sayramensis]MCG2840295.1 L,D-transpeptidase [Sandaracinobacteroides sayramensis]